MSHRKARRGVRRSARPSSPTRLHNAARRLPFALSSLSPPPKMRKEANRRRSRKLSSSASDRGVSSAASRRRPLSPPPPHPPPPPPPPKAIRMHPPMLPPLILLPPPKLNKVRPRLRPRPSPTSSCLVSFGNVRTTLTDVRGRTASMQQQNV